MCMSVKAPRIPPPPPPPVYAPPPAPTERAKRTVNPRLKRRAMAKKTGGSRGLRIKRGQNSTTLNVGGQTTGSSLNA
jgi:hypothetical protein